MLIKDTTNLKVGDFLRITHISGASNYYYKVVDMYNVYDFIAYEFQRRIVVGLRFDYLDEYNVYIMSEEESSVYLLEL